MSNQQLPPSPDLHIVEQQNFLTANLLDFFRIIDNENKWMQAVKIAVNQIERIHRRSSPIFENRVLSLAHRLKNNVSHLSIRQFANDAILSAAKIGLLKEEKNYAPGMGVKNLEKRATKEIANAITTGYSESSATQRAANTLYQQKTESERMEHQRRAINKHPLKDVLSVLVQQSTPLPKEDIRSHFLRLNKKPRSSSSPNKLFSLLEKAQAFSALRIHQLLDDELFFLCRPIGFLDMKEEIILIEVPSNAHLHMLTYRKLEILRCLKKDPTFFNAKSLRFKINGSLF